MTIGRAGPHDRLVERAEAIERLPVSYAVALRLHEAGAADDLIAAALGSDPLSVPALLELARRKLAEVTTSPHLFDIKEHQT